MASDGSCLGVCYTENQLYYSVNNPERDGHLAHIGSIEYNFEVENSIITGKDPGFPAIQSSLRQIKEAHNCSSVHILAPATKECWTIVPRSVYDDASEREAHIQLFMNGYDRSDVQVTWHPLSNDENRLLLIRNSSAMKGFRHLMGGFSSSEYVSEFEIGREWIRHKANNGSYLMVNCRENHISLSSFILGKLRGCTFIEFDSYNDLPYYWNLYSENISWMNGIHDNTCLFGQNCQKVADILNPYLEDSTNIQIMNSLSRIDVSANEKTYGFDLERAFPAIVMSLNAGEKASEL